jgi:type IV pilus assembly protein PilB
VLLRLGLIDHQRLAAAFEARLATGGATPLRSVLVDLGLVDESDVARALAVLHVLPLVELDPAGVDPAAVRSVPREAGGTSVAFAWRGARLAVAVADPDDGVDLDAIRARSGAEALDLHIAPASRILATLEAVWGDDSAPASAVGATADDAETVLLVDRLLIDAVHARATELAVEPQRDGLHVRLRVDGVLRHHMTLPLTGAGAIVDWLKAIADLDLDETRLPQQGRAVALVQGDSVALHVATLPTVAGERVVVRLRPTSRSLPSLGTLGLSGSQQQVLLDTVNRRTGMVLAVGPVGAGRTHTLHAVLTGGVDPDRSIVALEDPVEGELPGVLQVPVDPSIGLTYASALEAALHQGPDVVLIGDLGDHDTAPLAVHAAATDRLVLASMLAVDASDALVRLVRLGAEPSDVAGAVSLVLSQRLVRTPCPDCVVAHDPDPYLLASLWVTDPRGTWVQAPGCLACSGTGYRGRVAVVELLEVGPEVRRALVETDDEGAVRRAARAAGVRSMREHAVELARRGGTTLDEIVRAVPDDPDHSS